MGKKSQALEIVKKKKMSKASPQALLADLQDGNSTSNVDPDQVPTSDKASVLYKGQDKQATAKRSNYQIGSKGVFQPSGEKGGVSNVGRNVRDIKQVGEQKAMHEKKISELKSMPKPNLTKAAGMPSAPKAPKSPAQALKPEGLVPPGTQASMTAGKQNKPKLSTPTKVSNSMKAPMQKKESKMLKLVKSKMKNKSAKEQKGVHNPHFGANYETGTSEVGAFMSPGGASKETNKWAKEAHKEKLAELKAMPKPKLTKSEAQAEAYLVKARQMNEVGHKLAGFKLAQEVLAKAKTDSDFAKEASAIVGAFEPREVFQPQEVAVAVLAKAEVMAKTETEGPSTKDAESETGTRKTSAILEWTKKKKQKEPKTAKDTSLEVIADLQEKS